MNSSMNSFVGSFSAMILHYSAMISQYWLHAHKFVFDFMNQNSSMMYFYESEFIIDEFMFMIHELRIKNLYSYLSDI